MIGPANKSRSSEQMNGAAAGHTASEDVDPILLEVRDQRGKGSARLRSLEKFSDKDEEYRAPPIPRRGSSVTGPTVHARTSSLTDIARRTQERPGGGSGSGET